MQEQLIVFIRKVRAVVRQYFDIAPAYLSAKDGAELRKSLL